MIFHQRTNSKSWKTMITNINAFAAPSVKWNYYHGNISNRLYSYYKINFNIIDTNYTQICLCYMLVLFVQLSSYYLLCYHNNKKCKCFTLYYVVPPINPQKNCKPFMSSKVSVITHTKLTVMPTLVHVLIKALIMLWRRMW